MVETRMRYLLPFALLVGCQTYPTLEEACNDTLPGGSAITDPVDADIGLWMNCHRRQSRLPQLRVDPLLQASVEAHAAYLTVNRPISDQYFQIAGNEPFTGRTGLERARAAGGLAHGVSELRGGAVVLLDVRRLRNFRFRHGRCRPFGVSQIPSPIVRYCRSGPRSCEGAALIG